MITVLEDDAILPHMFERRIDAARWLVGEMRHDDVKLLYLFCREQIVQNLKKLESKKNEYV